MTTLMLTLTILVSACSTPVPEENDQRQPTAGTAATSVGAPSTDADAPTAISQPEAAAATIATGATATPLAQPTALSYDPKALVVSMQERPVLPENIATLLTITPPEGGIGGSIVNCLNSFPESGVEQLAPTATSVKIGETLTLCYFAFTQGVITERVLDPQGVEIRSVTFTTEPSIFGNLEASNYTPLPNDAFGTYQVIAETPDGVVQTSFVVEEGYLTEIEQAQYLSRRLVSIGRGTGYHSIDDIDYVFAIGFEPGESLDLYFYEACTLSGARRLAQRSGTFRTSAQARVNDAGDAIMRISPEIRAALAGVIDVVLFARGDSRSSGVAPVSPPPDIERSPNTLGNGNFSITRPLNAYSDISDKLFDGSEDPFDYTTRGAREPLPLCPTPTNAVPTAAVPAGQELRTPLLSVRLRDILQPSDQIFSITRLSVEGITLFTTAVTELGGPDNTVAIDLATGAGTMTTPRFPPPSADTVFPDDQEQELYRFTADGQTYVATGSGGLYTIDDGLGRPQEFFKTEINWMSWITKVANPVMVAPSVSVSGDTVFIGGADKIVYAIDRNTGITRWTFPLELGPSAPPVISGDTVFVGSYDGNLYALDVQTGAERWRFAAGDWINQPVIDGSQVVIYSDNELLFGLDVATGQERWRYAAPGRIAAPPLFFDGGIVVAVAQELIPTGFGRSLNVHLYLLSDSKRLSTYLKSQVVASPSSSSGRRFRTISTADGFVSVRSEPTTTSAEVTRLASGTEVACEGSVVGEAIDGATGWAVCPEAGGYIFGPLLQPVATSAPVPTPVANSGCVDPQGDVALAYVDLIGAAATVRGESMAAVFRLAGLPATLAYNKPGVQESAREYMWEVEIFLDGTQTDAAGNKRKSDYSMTAAKWRGGGTYAEEPLGHGFRST